MISVCMAVYNGETYLLEQISSILNQLNNNDELIIVNDNSSDRTTEVIKNINDDRIRLFNNEENRGVIKSFELAITLSAGDYIYLSDQDDVWVDNKIEVTQKYFNENNKVKLIVSDAFVTDENLNIINNSFYDIRKSRAGFWKNFYKNSFLGCAMAFRSDMKKILLPIPQNVPMHDYWIGLIISIYSDTLFIKDKLIFYRRHGSTVTNLEKNNGLSIILTSRVKLLKEIMSRYLKNNFKGVTR
ncbi:glycosyltransferase family 2 protein [Rossellomorea aquimaris]|jgi:glycosyltransferase involved in cell wall biosynthesis|uniref:glycosyltransferase family 2 protein n=1 Tax=Rossellomorea aquimaris TaxID=189382 RepID=UPI0005C923EB|nr:glycosyltransferase family 2 protein [Rossellomorea aquimaris]